MSFIRKEDWVQALGGGQGGLAAILVTLPIESVQKMQGISKGKAPSIAECIRTIYRSGGLPEFYRGISPLVIQCFVEKFAYFLPYSIIVNAYQKRFGLVGYGMNLFLGYAAEIIRIPFTYPIEVVSTYTQTHPDERNMLTTTRTVYKQGGLVAFWRGMEGYVMVGARPAISLMVFDQVKRAYLLRMGRPITSLVSFGEAFLIGALGRLAATLICYPCFQQKCRRQAGQSGMLVLLREEGLGGLYKGFAAEVTRGVVFNAVMMAVKESIETFNNQLFGLQLA